MLMVIRRILSHAFIACAVFCLVATYFIWVIDATFLNSKALNAALNDAGVPSAVASYIPDKLVEGTEQKLDEQTHAKIAQIITPSYVQKKMNEATSSIIAYVRNGEPTPQIQLKDFAAQLRDAGLDISQEQAAQFDNPILLSPNGELSKIPDYYKKLDLIKYFGIVLFIILISFEWIVTEKGKKLRRLSRIFLHSGLWFLLFWLSLVFIPQRLVSNMTNDPATSDAAALSLTIIDTLKRLLTPQLLGAAVVCLLIAAIMYALRHVKHHVDTINEVPTARIRSQAVAKLPTRN